MREFEAFDTVAERKKAVVRAIERVSKHLGNTPAVCRRCYIHPEIFEGYLDGTLLEALAEKSRAYLADNLDGMSPEEAAVTAFLRLRLGEMAAESRAARKRGRSGDSAAAKIVENAGKEPVSGASD